ncbi:MAG TPA: PQQ-binding-like beta-propeller repeat protein [Kofleriaceae bacterium]|nr:PQQ-binding-like beta-propeller repeat protein [Kofleriaceae bacterium]
MFRREPRHGGDARDHRALAWEVAWQVELGERVDASPIVVENGVVVATRGGTVVLLDPGTGAERARASLGGSIWATPAAANGMIVVGVVAKGGAELVGLGARDLHVWWRREAGPRVRSFGAGTAEGERVLLCAGDALVSIRAYDGREMGRHGVGDRCFGAPAIDGHTAYVGTRAGTVVAVAYAHQRHAGGRARGGWTAPTRSLAFNDGAPVVAGDLVLVGSNNGYLHAFAKVNGAHLWRVGDGDWVVSAPAIADGLAIFGDDGDVVRAVSLADGSERWRGEVGGDVASSAVVVGEHVVHGAHDGKVHAWRLNDGAPLEPIDAGAPMFASPAVTGDGMVVIATHKGRVLAIR